ncbi:MAG: MFS transporter [Actinobacteria bacterium]|nr:MFS transporter [Actinomycetota bacterium]
MRTEDNAPTPPSGRPRLTPASTGAAAPAREPIWTRDFVLICLINVLAMWGFTMLMPTLPVYVKKMGGQESAIGLIMGIFALSALASRPWSGRWMDRKGRRGIYLVSLSAVVPIYLAYGLVPTTIFWLGALRLLHGLCFGVMMTAGGTIVADAVPAGRRGEGIGYFGTFAVISSALAPATGIALMGRFGFGTVAAVAAGLAFVSVFLARAIRYQPLPTRARGPASASAPGPFARYAERRSVAPSVIALFLYCAQTSVLTFLPVHASEKGIGNIGLFFAVNAVTVMSFRALAGKLYDTRGPSFVIVPGILVAVTAMLVVGLADNLAMLLFGAVLLGVGMGATAPSLQALSVDGVAPERRGAANSTYFSALDIGMGGGAILLGMVAQAFGYPVMYFAAAGLAACGAVLFGILRPRRSPVLKEVHLAHDVRQPA